jgi:hypothetical protein
MPVGLDAPQFVSNGPLGLTPVPVSLWRHVAHGPEPAVGRWRPGFERHGLPLSMTFNSDVRRSSQGR